jgi:flagellar hook assembly protein FlgD
VSGTITTDTTWALTGSPYIVTGNITVYGTPSNTVTLTIEAGVEVEFGQNKRLTIGSGTNKGALRALGTDLDPILFTSNQTTKTAGYWDWIEFTSGTDATLTLMEHAIVEYGGSGASYKGAVHIDGASPTIKNTTIRDCNYNAIKIKGTTSYPVLDTVAVENCKYAGIHVDAGGMNVKDLNFTSGPITQATYQINMLANTQVTSTGTHTLDKPVCLRYAIISADVTWHNLGSPYVSQDIVYIYKNTSTPATLTIEEGTEIRFKQNKALLIGSGSNKGNIIAQGSAASPILFTSDQTTKTRGYWYGLRFAGSSDGTSLLDHVTVEYGGKNGYGGQANIVASTNAAPTIQNSLIQQSSTFGVYSSASLALKATTVQNNTWAGLYVASGSVNFEDVTFAGNEGIYSASMLATTPVTASGTNSFGKNIELRYAQVSADTVWRYLGTPYVLPSSISVAKNTVESATLTIEPGVELRLNQGVDLTIGGTYKGLLMAKGTPDAPIIVTSNQTTKTPGFWGRINIQSGGASNSVLSHVILEYGGGTVYNGLMSVYQTSPIARNCAFRHSSNHGITVNGTSAFPDLKDNNFVDIPANAVHNNTPNGIDARASWWNDATGPSGVGSGSGAGVSANVFYMPWLETVQNPYYTVTDASLTDTTFNKHTGSTTLSATLSAPGNWSLQVLDDASQAVKTYSGSGGAALQAWDGEQEGSSEKADDGDYTLRLTAADSTTGQPMAPLIAKVTVEGGAGDPNDPVAIISSPASAAVLAGGDPVSVTGTATDANDFDSYRLEYGEGTSPTSWSVITSPPDITSQVQDGELASWSTDGLNGSTYQLRLTVKDSSSPDAIATVTVNLLTITDLQTSEQYFSPNGDLSKDTTRFTGTISYPADWTLSIKNASAQTVKTFVGNGTTVNELWNGKDTSEQVVPDGSYTYVLDATEPSSSVSASPISGVVYVDVSEPTAEFTAPLPSATVFDTVSITGTASEAEGIKDYKIHYGAGASPGSWNSVAYSTDPVVDGTLAEWQTNDYMEVNPISSGSGTYTLWLQVEDLAGNVGEDQVTFDVDNLFITNVSASANLIHPMAAETSEIFFSLNRNVADAKLRILPEMTLWKVYPDQTPESGAVKTVDFGSLTAGTHSFIWDGKNDAGQFVEDEAYIYVIEAQTASGRFDKFNQYKSHPFTDIPWPYWVEFPVEATDYNPWANEIISHTFDITASAGRGCFRVRYTDSLGVEHQVMAHRHDLISLGQNTFFWDGRDESGNIVTDIDTIDYIICGFDRSCDICTDDDQSSFHPLKRNYVQVVGTTPQIPVLSIKSDPYVIYLSYSHIVGLQYHLDTDARVSVTIKDSSGAVVRNLVTAESQVAGDQEVIWDGTDDSGELIVGEADYTFVITATLPNSLGSVTRRGNITVRK